MVLKNSSRTRTSLSIGRGQGVDWRRPVLRALAFALFMGLWEVQALRFGPGIVPSPAEVGTALVRLLPEQDFWAAVWATISGSIIGLAIAAVLAVPLGMLVGASPFFGVSTRLSVDFLRTIPPVTLIPLIVLLYGPSTWMKIVLIVFGCIWPLFVQATYAIREVDPVLRDFARAFRLRTRFLWLNVLLPSSAPFLLTGFRIASTIALLLAVAAELIGNAPGIGREITLAQMGAQVPTAYAYVVIAALLGVAVNLGTGLGQRKALFWHPSVRGR